MPRTIHDKPYMDENHDKEIELPLFELSILVQATHNFSRDKILGVGGYGPVYWVSLLLLDADWLWLRQTHQ